MHVNQQVREAAKVAAESTSIRAVYTNRGADLTDVDLPALVIGTGADEVEEVDKGGVERRTITLTGVVVADGEADELDDDLDALRAELEAAMAGGLAGLAKVIEHTGGELDMGTDEDGERWYAFYALSWRVEVWTEAGDPETAI